VYGTCDVFLAESVLIIINGLKVVSCSFRPSIIVLKHDGMRCCSFGPTFRKSVYQSDSFGMKEERLELAINTYTKS
jgi:hypothetical protein